LQWNKNKINNQPVHQLGEVILTVMQPWTWEHAPLLGVEKCHGNASPNMASHNSNSGVAAG